MSKLDDIEAYFASSVNQARQPELQGEYEDWLIAEVRKLRRALEPFANITEFEVNERYKLAGKILAADIQRARKALEET